MCIRIRAWALASDPMASGNVASQSGVTTQALPIRRHVSSSASPPNVVSAIRRHDSMRLHSSSSPPNAKQCGVTTQYSLSTDNSALDNVASQFGVTYSNAASGFGVRPFATLPQAAAPYIPSHELNRSHDTLFCDCRTFSAMHGFLVEGLSAMRRVFSLLRTSRIAPLREGLSSGIR